MSVLRHWAQTTLAERSAWEEAWEACPLNHSSVKSVSGHTI